MKQTIRKIVLNAARKAYENGVLVSDQIPEMEIEEPKHPSHGDFSTNFAMVSASIQKMPPRKIAESLVSFIETGTLVEKIEIAGPGFINFFLSNKAWHPVIERILEQDKAYGASDMGKNKKSAGGICQCKSHRSSARRPWQRSCGGGFCR